MTARQCGIPIVPVRIGNPEPADFRLRAHRAEASIHFERAIQPGPMTSDAELARMLREFYERPERSDRDAT